MPKPCHAPLALYPAYCFSLSPTFNVWARLTAASVHALQERAGFEGQHLYFHLNHPIKWIRLVGVIVAIDIYVNRWVMLLDDSSGATIAITCGRPKPIIPLKVIGDDHGFAQTSTMMLPTEGATATGRTIDLTGIDIGTVVKVKGGIGSYRGEKQVLLEKISIIHTTSEEASAWAGVTTFREDILNQPWFVDELDERRAKRRAEGLDRKDKARAERKRRKLFSVKDRAAEVGKGGKGREESKRRQDEERKRREGIKSKQDEERKKIEEAKQRQENKNSVAREEQHKMDEEVKHLAYEERMATDEKAKRLRVEIERKEETRRRRENERKMREQEYERLLRAKNRASKTVGEIR